VGKVDDLIVTPDKILSFAIIGAGGFVGFGHHDVAVPVNLFQRHNGKRVLMGVTGARVNALMTAADWEIARRIVNREPGGNDRVGAV
jgi:hypothetical protein